MTLTLIRLMPISAITLPVIVAKSEGGADDQRRRDDPHQTRQHMLEGAKKGRKRWDPLFKAVKQAAVMFVRHGVIP